MSRLLLQQWSALLCRAPLGAAQLPLLLVTPQPCTHRAPASQCALSTLKRLRNNCRCARQTARARASYIMPCLTQPAQPHALLNPACPPIELQVCTADGTCMDIVNAVPYIQKFKKHPVTGAPLALADLIRWVNPILCTGCNGFTPCLALGASHQLLASCRALSSLCAVLPPKAAGVAQACMHVPGTNGAGSMSTHTDVPGKRASQR